MVLRSRNRGSDPPVVGADCADQEGPRNRSEPAHVEPPLESGRISLGVSDRGTEQVVRIQRDLACLRCQYSLRGHEGEVVTCPECGTRNEMSKLIMLTWMGSVYRAPGVSRIVWPVSWLGIGLMLDLNISAMFWPYAGHVVAIVIFVGWPYWLWELRTMMPGGRAVLLSLLAHLVTAGYLTAIFAPLWLIFLGAVELELPGLTAAAGGLALPIALWMVCRRGERLIGRQCIRQHLMDKTNSADPSA